MSEKSLREQLVGAWTLISCVERDIETGVESHPLGAQVSSRRCSRTRPEHVGHSTPHH